MAFDGLAALGVWHSVTSEAIRMVEAWYNEEHHRERVEIKGFLRARRYLNRGRGPLFFSRYDVRDLDVLSSEDYMRALGNSTPRSKEVFPHYRNTVRGAFRVVARAGVPDGGELLSLRFHDREADAHALEARLCALIPGLVSEIEGVVRAELWRVDVPTTTIKTREKTLRTTPDIYPTLALLIDLTNEARAIECIGGSLLAEFIDQAQVDHMRLVFMLGDA